MILFSNLLNLFYDKFVRNSFRFHPKKDKEISNSKYLCAIINYSRQMKLDITPHDRFESRHNAIKSSDLQVMLESIGAESLDKLIDETVPPHIRLKEPLQLPKAKSEHQFLEDFRTLATKNKLFKNYIGLGYYDCHTPGVIQRNILENPGWYTAYTPYQAEIAQGRLEALINFQTTVIDLTGMEIANASLLDEGTAAAEAMYMLAHLRKGARKDATRFFVDERCFPQTIDILKTRTHPLGYDLEIGKIEEKDITDPELFGVLIQYPDNNGEVRDFTSFIESAHEHSVPVVVAADLMSLALLKSPGEMGADVVIGTTQRFGIPMGFGGPHAAYFATRESYKRNIPGRIIGISKDRDGRDGYRMALQTREQHIRREKATSNICTAQVLLGVMAGMYAVYHGPVGLQKIAGRIHRYTQLVDNGLKALGFEQQNGIYFDTLKVRSTEINRLRAVAEDHQINFRYFGEDSLGISLDETTTSNDVQNILKVFATVAGKNYSSSEDNLDQLELSWPDSLIRETPYLEHPVFNTYHSEHELLRYMKKLENKDLSLAHSMISLGSCTMKLNATTEMIPVTWPEFGSMHPFAPSEQTSGYLELFNDLESWLSVITGFSGTSLQPNSGAQGEFAGLMVIQAYHKSRGDAHRNITIIPKSAHGTNPASAVMAGTKVVIVDTDEHGNIDVEDLKSKAELHKENLAALMVTYPSTHGVYEEKIQEICQIIHDFGGQVYMDGANMNAQVGLTSPAIIGADVCHLNLHKTFCIPHGGGGPGVGPICVAEHLVTFLPSNPVVATGGEQGITSISAAPWGSASILPISYAYIAMMGGDGLKNATEIAILNANYIKSRLESHFPILYTGTHGRCAHEMIIDCRDFKHQGVEVEDIAKRLMDYGFHSPTVSFPVPGTMMIEPTESEPKAELDRFCDAMISIRAEIREIESGEFDADNNVLKNAPHTIGNAAGNEWDMPYSRDKAVFPLNFVRENKFWPSVSRIDNAYGDRNLVCSCLPMEDYLEQTVDG